LIGAIVPDAAKGGALCQGSLLKSGSDGAPLFLMRSLLASSLTCLLAQGADPKVASEPKSHSNDKVKVGVDMPSGGSIFCLSELPSGPNLLNHADRGRFDEIRKRAALKP